GKIFRRGAPPCCGGRAFGARQASTSRDVMRGLDPRMAPAWRKSWSKDASGLAHGIDGPPSPAKRKTRQAPALRRLDVGRGYPPRVELRPGSLCPRKPLVTIAARSD